MITNQQETKRKNLFKIDLNHSCINNFLIKDNIIQSKSGHWDKFVSLNPISQYGQNSFEISEFNAKQTILCGFVLESKKSEPKFSFKREYLIYNPSSGAISCIQSNKLITKSASRRPQRKECVKVMINDELHNFEIWIKDEKIGCCRIPEYLWNQKLYAFVTMSDAEDSVRLQLQ